MSNSHINKQSKILLAVFAITILYWFGLFVTKTKYSAWDYWYQVLLAIIPLLGGYFGFRNSRKWGGLKSRLGQATFYIAAGLTTWGIGQCYWSYVTIRGFSEVPYPSLADVGYIASWPLWTIGIVFMALAAGAKFSLRKHAPLKLYCGIAVIAAAVIAASYYLLIVVARGGLALDGESFIRVVFDLAYPVGDVVILSIAAFSYTFLFRYLGGRYKFAITLIILGYALNYVTDFTFSYVTTAGTYFNGHFVDVMFPAVMTVLSIGLALMEPPKVDTGPRAQ